MEDFRAFQQNAETTMSIVNESMDVNTQRFSHTTEMSRAAAGVPGVARQAKQEHATNADAAHSVSTNSTPPPTPQLRPTPHTSPELDAEEVLSIGEPMLPYAMLIAEEGANASPVADLQSSKQIAGNEDSVSEDRCENEHTKEDEGGIQGE